MKLFRYKNSVFFIAPIETRSGRRFLVECVSGTWNGYRAYTDNPNLYEDCSSLRAYKQAPAKRTLFLLVNSNMANKLDRHLTDQEKENYIGRVNTLAPIKGYSPKKRRQFWNSFARLERKAQQLTESDARGDFLGDNDKERAKIIRKVNSYFENPDTIVFNTVPYAYCLKIKGVRGRVVDFKDWGENVPLCPVGE